MSKDAPGASVAPKTTKSAEKGEQAGEPKAKAARKPRVDYGYKPGATITLTDKDGSKYGGKRGVYYAALKACNGKTVEDFEAACPEGDTPRGWLRFLVQDGAATLSGGKAKEPKPKAAKKEPALKAV